MIRTQTHNISILRYIFHVRNKPIRVWCVIYNKNLMEILYKTIRCTWRKLLTVYITTVLCFGAKANLFFMCVASLWSVIRLTLACTQLMFCLQFTGLHIFVTKCWVINVDGVVIRYKLYLLRQFILCLLSKERNLCDDERIHS